MAKIEWYSIYSLNLFRARIKPDGSLVAEKYEPKFDIWVGKGAWTEGSKTLSECALEGTRIPESEAYERMKELRAQYIQ